MSTPLEKHSIKGMSETINRILKKVPQKEKDSIAFEMMMSAMVDTLMEQRGINEAELAKLANVDQADVKSWLTGMHHFTSKDIGAIASAFGLPIDSFFERYRPLYMSPGAYAVWRNEQEVTDPWQPIETAPKDEVVLVCKTHHKYDNSGYYAPESAILHYGEWVNTGYFALEYNPTHWMPLPEPPTII